MTTPFWIVISLCLIAIAYRIYTERTPEQRKNEIEIRKKISNWISNNGGIKTLRNPYRKS
jgi:hypothetical protein